jgi:hypothetical protein
MAIKIDTAVTVRSLARLLDRVFALSGEKILALEKSWDPAKGTPVFTARGKYTTRGWTEWTQGFQFGSALLQFEACSEEEFLEIGRRKTRECMATHVSHIGVHDHGFNNLSTYGNLWRFMREGLIPAKEDEQAFYEMALKVSGAVQAARWTELEGGRGYIYSFNGPHSLFIDTVRSLRSLGVAYQLRHVLMGEHDQRINLLHRLLLHLESTASYSVSYGTGQDAYDERGRVTQECIFNLNDGQFRCRSTQQGFSPFSTWTRGLAWAVCGFAEQLEFLDSLTPQSFNADPNYPAAMAFGGGKDKALQAVREAATATADYYLDHCCADGVPMWDTAAPLLHRLGDYLGRPADPFNPWEPVDSSAAAITAQGLLRLGAYLEGKGKQKAGRRYCQAGLTISKALFDEPYLSTSPGHQGLLLHSIYHRPRGWDSTPRGQTIPNGESSMWGDYHLRELALMLLRKNRGAPFPVFFRP